MPAKIILVPTRSYTDRLATAHSMVSSNGVDPVRGGTKRARKPERERSRSPTPTPSLETDDEVDEFAEDYQSDDDDGTDAEGSDDDVQGVTRYEPDELDGLEDEVETDDESASDDPGRGGGDERSERSAQLVSCCMLRAQTVD